MNKHKSQNKKERNTDTMFESIEDAVATWKEEYSFIEDAVVTGYEGGYPKIGRASCRERV